MKKKIIMSAVMFVVSVLIALLAKFCNVAQIGPSGTSIGLSAMNGYFHERIGMNESWYKLSEVAGYAAILCVLYFAIKGFVQLVKGKSLLAVDRNILLMGLVFLAIIFLYILFEIFPVNFRPVLESGCSTPEPSFPSSHAMLACTVFLTCAQYIKLTSSNTAGSFVLIIVLYTVSVIAVISRLMSGVHWVTDIVAGVSISLCLVFLYSALSERMP